jgi:quinol monooxygenase YgiN
MELLVVTLAQANPSREGEALARMRLISDTIRNAPGLSNARFYRSREPESAYFLLTTWESAEWWQKAQERQSPYRLLQTSPAGIFPTPPDQWLMHYLWGYSRPLAGTAVAAAHLALVRLEQSERVQQAWLESLQQQAVEPILSFALLARSIEETAGGENQRPGRQNPLFLNLLSWPGETYREDFYTNESYRNLQALLNSAGMLRILKLDPI